jgi:F420-dependent oxidoreductase-like protein
MVLSTASVASTRSIDGSAAVEEGIEPMRFALMIEPQQGLSYEEVLAVARTAEESGFEAFFRSDHYASFPGDAGLPTTDCWATLAGLARETTRIHLGALVSPVTFRIPGAFAKQVATVDEMSGGRVELGVGAGWNDLDHAQLGIPFPEVGERADMLEEELAILRGLWDEDDGWSCEGKHWQVRDSLFRPKGPRPNLIVGGTGKPRSLRLGARYADEYNVSSSAPSDVAAVYGRLDAACVAIGREPRSIVHSVMAGVLIGRDESEVRERAAAQIEFLGARGRDAEEWLEERRLRWVTGTPDEARARVAEFEASGVQRLMLQTFLPRDLGQVRLMAEMLFHDA